MVPFVVSVLSFWVMNRIVYCYSQLEGEAFQKIVYLAEKPQVIFGFPIVSFDVNALAFPLLIAFTIYILIVTRKKRNLRTGAEHGSAKWADNDEILKYMDKDPKENIILTKTEGLTIKPHLGEPLNGRNKNVALAGGTGAGKSRFWVTPNLMQCHSSYVITDPKGTILDNVGHLLQKAGYEIKIFNLVDMDKSMHYNPFEYIRSEKDILKFAEMLVESTKSEDEKADFWVKSEKLLYMALVGYIYYECPKEEQTMETLLQLLNSSQVSEKNEDAQNPVDLLFDELEEAYREKFPDSTEGHFAVNQYKKYKLAAGKTAKSILISCGVRLSPFDIAGVKRLTVDDDMELDKLGDRKTALFCITPDTDKSLNFIAAFMYMQMFNILCTVADNKYGGSLPVHVRCLFDEFRNIGKIPMFEILIATIRSRNISACIVLQTFSQLKAVYKDDAETIKGCCDTTIFLGGQEKTTLKEISDLLGNETIEVINTSRSYGRQGSSSVSYQKQARKLMDESELFKLSGKKCILTIRGSDPWCSYKYDIKDHPNYKYLAEADPKANAFDTKKYLENYYKKKVNKGKIITDIEIKDGEEIIDCGYFDPDDFDESDFFNILDEND